MELYRWIKASERDFDSNIGKKSWRINGEAGTAGMAFVFFKRKTGDVIELLEQIPEISQDELWEELENDFYKSRGGRKMGVYETVFNWLKQSYHLIKKQ